MLSNKQKLSLPILFTSLFLVTNLVFAKAIYTTDVPENNVNKKSNQEVDELNKTKNNLKWSNSFYKKKYNNQIKTFFETPRQNSDSLKESKESSNLKNKELTTLSGNFGVIMPEDANTTFDITAENDAVTLVNYLFVPNTDLTLVSQTVFETGSIAQIGIFNDGKTITDNLGSKEAFLSFDKGLIFSTGDVTVLDDTLSNLGNASKGISGAISTDLDFSSSDSNPYDVASLEFVVNIPVGGEISGEFIFASDEYNDYVNYGVNDAAKIFVNGQNVALTPGGSELSIDTINNNLESSEFIDNETDPTRINIEADGFTRTIKFTANLNAGNNTIKIGIADNGDNYLDSWFLFKANSFNILIDTDKDGVNDVEDIDDDNDGVLDTEEFNITTIVENDAVNSTTNLSAVEGQSSTPITFYGVGKTVTATLSQTGGKFLNGTETDIIRFNENGGNYPNQTWNLDFGTNPIYDLELYFGTLDNSSIGDIKIGNFILTLEDDTVVNGADFLMEQGNSHGFTSFESNARDIIKTNSLNSTPTIEATFQPSGEGRQAEGTLSFSNIGAYSDFNGLKSISWTVDAGSGGGPTASLGISVKTLYEVNVSSIDTDNDGIPNHLDLDSDGDGCPDAIESGVTGTLEPGDLINGDGTTNTTTNTSSAIAQGPYGLNGLANFLGGIGNEDDMGATTSYVSTYSDALDAAINQACKVAGCIMVNPMNIRSSVKR